ncbi:MAG TPA: glycosyl hydrolase [Propionicimonas sp.]|nr:glycosyl hydrolase [Propionicimonas sp.]HQA77750.1 glycosyl hydrolase [Propionicimonas sp.]HQD97230.1 glycosyl hydrolase [Propionicimonas sp.]
MRTAAVVMAAVLAAGCTTGPPTGGSPAPVTSAPTTSAKSAVDVLGDAQVVDLLAAVPQRTPKALPAAKLAEGIAPPTNRWYSGLVFSGQPVFPLPLSFALTDDGFAFGLPVVKPTETTIFGGHAAQVSVAVGAKTSVVTSDDPSVVIVEQRDAEGAAIGHATIAQGSPFVSWTATKAAKLTIPSGFADVGNGLYVATLNGTRYALAGHDLKVDGTSVAVPADGTLAFWPLPEGREPAELVDRALATVTGSSVGYEVADDEVTTTLSYATTAPTAIARMPHQASGGECALGSYPSIYGALELCDGSSLTWTTPRTPALASLDLSGISAEQKAKLVEQLQADADLPDFPADSYFGGKSLQRAAMLVMVADQLGEQAIADELAARLDEQLSRWLEPNGCAEREAMCFVYDPAGKGMIGLTPSFGSDEYNDHHFHYGYFLYAAGVLAARDASAVSRYGPVLNLLAADIASSGGESFPQRRAFDVYASHSWASGTAPFADGNNQESVSEAVNAYAGLNLWAQASGDRALADESAWMLSAEADASTRYWTNPELSGTEFAGFGHQIVALNWGGKRDYATWFSAEPAAMLGILLLPMSPSSGYLAGDPERIRANVAEAVGEVADQKFGDYIAMYSALAGPEDRDRAVVAAEKLSDGTIDDGLSRTYLLAWLYSLKF